MTTVEGIARCSSASNEHEEAAAVAAVVARIGPSVANYVRQLWDYYSAGLQQKNDVSP